MFKPIGFILAGYDNEKNSDEWYKAYGLSSPRQLFWRDPELCEDAGGI